jgi:pimeloyl-ACP methyl ester carboxylesterase
VNTPPEAGPAPESRFADAAGVTYHYQELGEGQHTIFLHGGGPGCAGALMDHVSHHLQEERPAAYHAVVDGFLRSLEGDRP